MLVHGVNYRNVAFETIPVTFSIGDVRFIAASLSVHSQRLSPAAYENSVRIHETNEISVILKG